MNWKECLHKRKVVIFIGSGGVGKTSCSLAFAIFAAKQGLNVGILSIDPAKRLADALGIKLDNKFRKILSTDKDIKGSLKAAMIDQREVFDQMVHKYSPNEEIAQKISEHKLYQAASSKIAGSLEYMALAQLQDIVDSKKFDLVILDTPPDTNALAFLKKPNVLAGFKNNKVMSWLIKPFYLANRFGLKKFFSVGEKLMGGVSKVTGVQALSILSEFLMLMQNVIDGFHLAGEKVKKTLESEKTGFVLVTVPGNASKRSAMNLLKSLNSMKYYLDAIIFNKCFSLVKNCKKSDFNDISEKNIKTYMQSRYLKEGVLVSDLLDFVEGLFGYSSIFLNISEKNHTLHTPQAMKELSKDFIES